MKGSLVLLSSLLSIASSQGPGDGDHHRIPFNRGVAVTTWCDHFHKGTDASGGCDNGEDIVYDEPEDAKTYCEDNEDCLGVTKHPSGLFTPRCGNMYKEADNVPDILSWLNKDGCWLGCKTFQQKKDASGGCDNGEDIVYDEPEDAKTYCMDNEDCLGVTKHPNGLFTPRCGNMLPEDEVSDTVFWLNKDGCL